MLYLIFGKNYDSRPVIPKSYAMLRLSPTRPSLLLFYSIVFKASLIIPSRQVLIFLNHSLDLFGPKTGRSFFRLVQMDDGKQNLWFCEINSRRVWLKSLLSYAVIWLACLYFSICKLIFTGWNNGS